MSEEKKDEPQPKKIEVEVWMNIMPDGQRFVWLDKKMADSTQGTSRKLCIKLTGEYYD